MIQGGEVDVLLVHGDSVEPLLWKLWPSSVVGNTPFAKWDGVHGEAGFEVALCTAQSPFDSPFRVMPGEIVPGSWHGAAHVLCTSPCRRLFVSN